MRIKIDKLIEEDEPFISCIIVPRNLKDVSSTEADTQKLGITFKNLGLSKTGLHIEVEQGKIVQFMNAAFDPHFYDKYSFHLDKDEDDALPEPVDTTQATSKLPIIAAEKNAKKLMQVRKPLRRPLQVTSESFDPATLGNTDSSSQQVKDQSSGIKNADSIEPTLEEKKPDSESTKPQPVANTKSNPQKPATRKPLGNY